MENDLTWTKTILAVYRHLESVCGAMDKIVLQSGLNSMHCWGQDYFCNNIYTLSQNIIDMSERKVTLINLKILIEDVLSEIDEKDAQVLIERYFDDSKCREIAERRNVSLRTVFRKIANAERAFDKRLRMKGYNNLKLKTFLANEKWIKCVYEEFSCKNTEEICITRKFLEKAVSM